MRCAEVARTRADGVDDVLGEIVVADPHRVHRGAQRRDQVGVQDVLLQRQRVERAHDAGGLEQEVGAGEDGGGEPLRRLGHGLPVHDVGVGAGGAGADGQTAEVGELRRRHREARELGAAETDAARAQRRHHRQATVHERRALARGLAEEQRRQHLGVLHDEHPGRSRRAGRPAHDAGGRADRLTEARPAQRDARRLAGELQRSGGVEHDQRPRLLVPTGAEQDLVDAFRHVQILIRRRDPLDRLVAGEQARQRPSPRAFALGKIERLHAVAVQVDGGKHMSKLGGRLEIGESAGAKDRTGDATLQHVRGARPGAEHAPVGSTQGQSELGATTGQHERRRRRLQSTPHLLLRRVHPAAVAAHPPGAEQRDGLVVLHDDTGPLQHAQGTLVHDGHGGGLHDVVADDHVTSPARTPPPARRCGPPRLRPAARARARPAGGGPCGGPAP
ncbi:MAG: hypothetical protein BWY94_01716 [Actinobacteria bacterium ADurb.BinA094]|nr:MAG: hypothetical protein BWY94_01716 [Actinobacteria bacterium ADurb.BinA094]